MRWHTSTPRRVDSLACACHIIFEPVDGLLNACRCTGARSAQLVSGRLLAKAT